MPVAAGSDAHGIDPARAAEVIVTMPDGSGRRGSGYRVSTVAVLTAEHVVCGAATIRVRFNADRADEWSVEAVPAHGDRTHDVAVLRIVPPASGSPAGGSPVAAATFGRIGDREAVLTCAALGFPRFKLRSDGDGARPVGRFRDSHYAFGHAPVLSNRREGTLAFTVARPEADPDPAVSPWEGMSGAAVFTGGRIVGVVSRHHRSDGLGTLAARRVDRWLAAQDATALAELADLVPLPPRVQGLPDVVPAAVPAQLLEGYQALVRDIAPERLHDRDGEVDEVVRFCAGDEPYLWWQGGPWAGKSALASWLVLHPPAGVEPVSFFITTRFPGQSDSDAFLDAMLDQLGAVAGEAAPATPTSPGARYRAFRALLDRAAARITGRHARLLLVVDALDEDTRGRPGAGLDSIASLLPGRPPDGVRVMVTSRHHPGVLADVPAGHPLRRCRPRTLAAWPHARGVEINARQEFNRLLALPDDRPHALLTFVTASGGGLTALDLATLVQMPRFEVDRMVSGVFGRSLTPRASGYGSVDQPRGLIFAHETLRVDAERLLEADLPRYRERLHGWAAGFRDQGWPEHTPAYLLRPYGRLLIAIGDRDRLAALATDGTRHDLMLTVTHSDATALAEADEAARLIGTDPAADLATAGLVAVHRARLRHRQGLVPAQLAIAWATLGQYRRAEAAARSVIDPRWRAEAWTGIAEAVARHRLADRVATAVSEARTALARVGMPRVHAWRLARLAGALAGTDPATAGELARTAVDTARQLPRPTERATNLAWVARAMAGSDPQWSRRLLSEALRSARTADPGMQRLVAMASVAAAQTVLGAGIDTGEVGPLARRLVGRLPTRPEILLRALASAGLAAEAVSLVDAATDQSAHRRARWYATILEHTMVLARSSLPAYAPPDPAYTPPGPPGPPGPPMIRALRKRAETALAQVGGEPAEVAAASASLAIALFTVDGERAADAAHRAERQVRQAAPHWRASTLVSILPAARRTAPDTAARVRAALDALTVRTLGARHDRSIAVDLAQAGEWDRAARLARAAYARDRNTPSALCLAQVARHLTEAGPAGPAASGPAASSGPAAAPGPAALPGLAALAEALAAEAHAHAATAPPGDAGKARVLAEVAAALAPLDPARALAAGLAAEESFIQPRSRGADPSPATAGQADRIRADPLVGVYARIGRWDEAERCLSGIADRRQRCTALCAMAEAAAPSSPATASLLAARAHDEAGPLAAERAEALARIAIAVADVDPARARRLAEEASTVATAGESHIDGESPTAGESPIVAEALAPVLTAIARVAADADEPQRAALLGRARQLYLTFLAAPHGARPLAPLGPLAAFFPEEARRLCAGALEAVLHE